VFTPFSSFEEKGRDEVPAAKLEDITS